MKVVYAVLLSALLSACATPYGKYGLTGGYTDSRIDENTFSISVDVNGFTSQQTAELHALHRAAELTVQNGFDYFVIVGGANHSRAMVVAIPGASTSNTTVSGYGPSAQARTTTTYAPTTVVPMTFPNSTLMIKTFVGAKPAGSPNAYDGRAVLKHLGPQMREEQSEK